MLADVLIPPGLFWKKYSSCGGMSCGVGEGCLFFPFGLPLGLGVFDGVPGITVILSPSAMS
jgi:hypothetical protein